MPNHQRGFLGQLLAFQTIYNTGLMLMLSRNSGKQQVFLWKVKYTQRWQITKLPAGLKRVSLIAQSEQVIHDWSSILHTSIL